MGIRQYQRSIRPYQGLAESVITSNDIYLGDASMVNYSWITSSATASTLTLLGFEGTDQMGFTSALPAATAQAWSVIKASSAQGYISCDTIPRWGRFLRAPSLSSSSLFLTYYVGP